jgi:membrane-associated phospholipid phosphatase
VLYPGQNRESPIPATGAGSSVSARLLQLACMFAVLAACSLFIDLPVHAFCASGGIPGDLQRLLAWSELFAHGLGCVILALTMYVLDPARRCYIPRIFVGAFGAGLTADFIKLGIARVRPNHFTGGAVSETFAGWLPIFWPVDGFSRLDHRIQAFPSGHVAVATALAAGLIAIYPRGRLLFVFFALLAASQRIQSGAHFPSDTFGGAVVGCLVASALARTGWFSLVFDRCETRHALKLASDAPDANAIGLPNDLCRAA